MIRLGRRIPPRYVRNNGEGPASPWDGERLRKRAWDAVSRRWGFVLLLLAAAFVQEPGGTAAALASIGAAWIGWQLTAGRYEHGQQPTQTPSPSLSGNKPPLAPPPGPSAHSARSAQIRAPTTCRRCGTAVAAASDVCVCGARNPLQRPAAAAPKPAAAVHIDALRPPGAPRDSLPGAAIAHSIPGIPRLRFPVHHLSEGHDNYLAHAEHARWLENSARINRLAERELHDRDATSVPQLRSELARDGELRWQIFARDGYRCRDCGRSGEDVELTIDHVVPLSRGGTNVKTNLRTLCRSCNSRKGARPA